MTILVLLLVLDAVLHAVLVGRFGTKDNMPFLIFAVVDAALAIAVYLALPYSLWATLALSAFGLVGLTVTFNKPQRDKMFDKIIWVVDAAVIVCAVSLLFAR